MSTTDLHHYVRSLEQATQGWPAPLKRRRFMQAAMALAAGGILSATRSGSVLAQASSVRFSGYPFTLGVASGAPRHDSVVLWTRLIPEPLNAAGDGGMGPERIAVNWEVAEDEQFKTIVRKGAHRAIPELAHSVHVEVEGLEPGRWYFYRFMAGNEVSPVGRTRTAGVKEEKLRFAFASCQQYEQGFFSAYRHMLKESPDLVVFLGDYIYESSWGSNLVRRHAGPEAETLAQYRQRHAQCKTDADLKAMHAAAPWIVTWDDHEVDNDYADFQSEHLDPRFMGRRAAAYQAYYEHMPLALSALPRGPNMRIYDRFSFGTLAEFHVLDDRQYRSPQACPRPGMGGSAFQENCGERLSPGRTLLGAAQEKWLEGSLAQSRAVWNILAQQTMVAQWNTKTAGSGQNFWTDGWDGYPVSRKKLLDFIVQRKIANPVFIGGDVHAHHVNNVKADFDDSKAPTIASEFVGTSITSEAGPQDRLDAMKAVNPHALLADGAKRGYVVIDLNAKSLNAGMRQIDSEKLRDSKPAGSMDFVVEAGKADIRRA
ncbi:MAG: alkaline phosphatase D family protein [Betaproteobacteria bacterium]|nr:alkaline phosphatase D family protein [Betaproteobacteria bacterium]